MTYAIEIAAYLLMGCFTNFMAGYNAPTAQRKSGIVDNWWLVLKWPIAFPWIIGNFGACIRQGWQG